MKPGLEMYVETLGIAIALTTEVCAQANQEKKSLSGWSEDLQESRLAVRLLPNGMNEPLYPFRPSILKVFRESKDALGALISTQFKFPS